MELKHKQEERFYVIQNLLIVLNGIETHLRDALAGKLRSLLIVLNGIETHSLRHQKALQKLLIVLNGIETS